MFLIGLVEPKTMLALDIVGVDVPQAVFSMEIFSHADCVGVGLDH